MYVESIAVNPGRKMPGALSSARGAEPAADPLFEMLRPARLSIESLTATEVIDRQLVAMSMEELWQAVDAGQFYTEYHSKTGPALFPAWQFVAPAPLLMPPVIQALHERDCEDPGFFWTTPYDELLDLTPAEVLCGKLFVMRSTVSAGQSDYLHVPDAERQRIVLGQLDVLAERLPHPHA